MAQDSNITIRSTVAIGTVSLSLPTDRLPSTPMPPVTDRRAEDALHDAKEVVATINLSKTWEGALARVKWVMDTLSPVAEVRHNVLFSYPLLSRISSSASSVCKDGI
jgi:hypothetical protein